MTVTTHRDRTFDWHPRFDERSLAYRMAPQATKYPSEGKVWAPGPVLDQGREGSCVGNGVAGEAGAQPVPVPGIVEAVALSIFRRAQHLDQWPGEAYEGTSVLAGCLAGRERGWYGGFRWAKSAQELAHGIVDWDDGGPAIIGVEWREGSYETDELGVLQATGDVVGGHCIVVLGFVPTYGTKGFTDELEAQLADLGLLSAVQRVNGPAFVILNSWGETFGVNGLAVVPATVMTSWSRAGAEFAQPVQRSLGAKATSSTADEPVEASHTRTVHITAVELEVGDRITEGAPVAGSTTVRALSRRTRLGAPVIAVQATAGRFTLTPGAQLVVRRPIVDP